VRRHPATALLPLTRNTFHGSIGGMELDLSPRRGRLCHFDIINLWKTYYAKLKLNQLRFKEASTALSLGGKKRAKAKIELSRYLCILLLLKVAQIQWRHRIF